MRSLSVKKVAVAAAGAALLGMAFAGATTVDPSVGNFVFFKSGEPQVKVVVGTNAGISDGVAAAQIAAALGNLAYTNQAVTASAGGNSTGGTGTVSGQNVVLTVTAPVGAGTGTSQSGSMTISSQPYDFLEFKQAVANTTRGDWGAQNTPIGNGISSGGYHLSGDNNFPIAFKGSISNVGSNVVTEDEHLYLVGESYYTTATGTPGTYTADRMQVADVYNFTSTIPYYVGATLGGNLSSAAAGSYFDSSGNAILGTDTNLVTNANVAIQFLGQPYVITGFPNSFLSDGSSPLTAPSLSLGAQAVIQQLIPGASVTVGNTTVTVLSISPIATGGGNQPQVSYQISQNGNVVDTITLQQGQSQTSNGLVISAQLVFVGTGTTSFVKTAIYNQAVTLQPSSQNQVVFQGNTAWTTEDGSNPPSGLSQWNVGLTFVNQTVGNVPVPALSQITLTSGPSGKMPVGSSFNLLTAPVYKSLTFLGLASVPQDTLTLSSQSALSTFTITPPSSSVYGSTFLVNGTRASINGGNGYNYVKLQSGDSSAFQVNGVSVSSLYINKDIGGGVLYQDSGDSNMSYVPQSGGFNTPTLNASWTTFTYQYPSSPITNSFLVNWTATVNTTNTGIPVLNLGNSTNDTYIRIYEPVVANDPAGSTGRGYYQVDAYDNTSDSNYGSNLYNTALNSGSTQLTVPYTATAPGLGGNVNFGNGAQQVGYISPGGSKLSQVSTNLVSILYPQQLPMAQWFFGGSNNVTIGATGGQVSTVTLNSGGNYSLGTGYSVQVASIGGTASCTGGSTSAVCTPSSAAVVTSIDPTQLVELDSQANPSDQMIVVGGPYVNSVAAQMPGADTATEASGDSVVTVIGNNVLVAGFTAQDTMNAAQALVSWLDQNRATVRG